MARRPERVTDRRAALLRSLTAYRAVDDEEEGHHLAVLDLVAVAHNPFDRYSYSPGHVTASGWVIHPEGNRILLIHHAKLDIWVQPGGHVDPEDGDLVAAARREIAEETGLTDLEPVGGIVDVDVHRFPARGEQPDHRHFDVRFAFVSRTADLSHNHEARDARWVRLDDLADLGADRSVIRPARKLLGSDL